MRVFEKEREREGGKYKHVSGYVSMFSYGCMYVGACYEDVAIIIDVWEDTCE